MSIAPVVNSTIGVGFGTAAIRHDCYNIVTMALEEGFRKFDTAEENEWWYDQTNTARALRDFFAQGSCQEEDIRISTKIPPWKLTSIEDIRQSARDSRLELLGFCADETLLDDTGAVMHSIPFPLDVYYIHAPECWQGWHKQCENPPPTISLREAWKAMEYVANVDKAARRIGLSNVWPNQLLDIIDFVQQRLDAGETDPPPRMPDVLQAFADPIRPADDLRKICEDYFIEFVSYSTLGTQHRRPEGNPVLGSEIVKRIAAKHDRSTAEVVLSWAIQSGMSVIPRSSRRQHIRELARLLDDGGFLDENDLHDIGKLKDT